ncbi:beta-1,4 N-acetylgalactosaminyltransferase 1-like [Glandiceps talaboti]
MKTTTVFILFTATGLISIAIVFSGIGCHSDDDTSVEDREPHDRHARENTVYTSLKLSMDEALRKTGEEFRKMMKIGGFGCDCPKNLKHGPLTGTARERQRKEYMEWARRNRFNKEPIAVCQSLSPISYIGSGTTLETLESVRLVGLRIHPDVTALLGENYEKADFSLKFKSRSFFGTLYVALGGENLPGVKIEGNGTYELEISAGNNIDFLNVFLEHIVYNNTRYTIKARDVIDVSFLNFEVSINLLIRRSVMPILYDSAAKENICQKVTVATKTFERYEAVNKLVQSVNKFYPNMTIVIADDSRKPETIHGQHVKQYTMPFAEGLNAGKNLVLSQIRTKYFLWVDDDFVFTGKTKLELMLQKLESSTAELDLVAGMIQDRNGHVRPCGKENCWRTLKYDQGIDGNCVYKGKSWRHRTLEEFPNCQVLDLVTDFWMAKTHAVRKAGGFDIEFERIGHREFFVDTIGQLHIAQCDDVSILHAPITNKNYEKYRRMEIDPSEKQRYVDHLLFKNNLQCFESWFPKLISNTLLEKKKRT